MNLSTIITGNTTTYPHIHFPFMFDTFMYVRFLKRKNWENSHIKTLRSLPLFVKHDLSEALRIFVECDFQFTSKMTTFLITACLESITNRIQRLWNHAGNFSVAGVLSRMHTDNRNRNLSVVSRARKSKVEHRGREVCDQFLHTSYFLFLNFTSIETIVIKRGSTINKFCGPWSILTLDDLVWRANIFDKEACFGVNSTAAKC